MSQSTSKSASASASTAVFRADEWSDAQFVARAFADADFLKGERRQISSVDLTVVEGAGGLSAAMHALTVAVTDGEATTEHKFIIKHTKAGEVNLSKSRTTELFRESWFYGKLAERVLPKRALPRVVYNEYDAGTGAKLIVMEDLRTRGAVQAGYFFGANSCLNVGKDLQAETAAFAAATDTDVAPLAFLSAVYNEYDAETGAKLIFMEDLRTRGAVQAGYFFGNNSCLNVGTDLQAETIAFTAVTDTDVAPLASLSAAKQEVYNEYDAETGAKLIVMEDLRTRGAVQAGYFFGTNSCLNVGKDLQAETAAFPSVTDTDVALSAFLSAADMHGSYWCDRALLESPELDLLKGRGWLLGKDEERWQASMNWARTSWEKALAQQKKQDEGTAPDEGAVKYDPRLVALVTRSLATTFTEWVDAMRGKPFSLVHGDFHPANFMVVRPRDVDVDSSGSAESKNADASVANADSSTADSHPFSLIMLDFEVIGVGSGAQDLGQFMISHPSRADRRRMEGVVLPAYAERLAERIRERGDTSSESSGRDLNTSSDCGGSDANVPSLADVRAEYARGGLGRWVWLLSILAGICPPAMTQYFHDQVLEFAEDHELLGQVILPRP